MKTNAATTLADRPRVERVRELLNPASIAVIGASNSSWWTTHLLSNLHTGQFAGDLWLVNRRGEEVQGRPTYPTIADMPGVPELAVLLTGTGSIEGLLAQSREAGIRNAIVLAGGFAESGAEGLALQERIVADARKADQLFLGPNNLGFVNTHGKTLAFPQNLACPVPVRPGGVGVASQSGALAIYLIPYMINRGVGPSIAVTVGNEAMLTAVDVIDYLITDPNTKVIAAYLEQIKDPEHFMAVAARARDAGKPIVAFKAGRTEAAASVAAAHTGSLVGDDAVTDAVLRQIGVIRVDSIEQLVSTSNLLAEYGGMPGPRIGFVTASGAMCAVIAERAGETGIELAAPSERTVKELHAEGMPDEAAVNNPLDLTGSVANNPLMIPTANSLFAADESYDAVVTHADWAADADYEKLITYSLEPTLASYRDAGKPVIPMSFLPADLTEYAFDFAARTGYPLVLDSFDRGVPAVAHSAWWSGRLRELADDEEDAAPGAPLERPAGAEEWTEVELGDFLREQGVPVVPGVLADSAAAAMAAAEEIGYPVVAKIASKDIAHKSDIGGVRLNLRTAEEVRSAYEGILDAVRANAPEAAIRGVSIAPMRSGGVELLVGIVRDPQWGPMLAVGLGGVFVEVLQDTALRRLPVGPAEIRRMLLSLQGIELLRGFRGGQAADLDQVAQAIHAIAQVALRLGERINALEVNPLAVDGARIEALDVLIDWGD